MDLIDQFILYTCSMVQILTYIVHRLSGFGPTYRTENSDNFKDELSKLSASDGGDTPELAFSGMRLALQAVRPGSECFVFTDATAKDELLATEVRSLAVDKKVKVRENNYRLNRSIN